MKLNANLLRTRRMELGLTTRAVARTARVSQSVVKRLEQSGNADVLQVETLGAVLEALSLDLAEVLEKRPPTQAPDGLVSEVGALLHDRGRGVPLPEVAVVVGHSLDDVKDALDALDERLRPAGLRVNHASTGISIVPAVRPDAGSGSSRERAHYLSKLKQSDMALIHRILTGRVPANTVAATNNGNVSLSRLEGAGLVVNEDNELKLTAMASTALGLPTSAECAAII